jgi:hypothetical protein
MIEWFEDLSLGLRVKSESTSNSSLANSIRSRFI